VHNDLLAIEHIQVRIFTIRGYQVMIDRDLAEMYQVEVKRLNEQVKRNSERFPEAFRFQLYDIEKNELVANCDRFESLKHSTHNPYAFTEQGVAMLSAVLRSSTAVQVSIKIMEAFVQMRRFLTGNAGLFQRLDGMEQRHLQFKMETDHKFETVFQALEAKSAKPEHGIFFNGQMYDAYSFVATIIREAKKSIVLIDNYVDDSVLTLLSKRALKVSVRIYTKTISSQLQLDLKKYNSQYPAIEVQKFQDAHDRFLIIDKKELYHFGASLKDLGKKWFAFSKMNSLTQEVMEKLKKAGDGE
jgi:hypothetical protein